MPKIAKMLTEAEVRRIPAGKTVALGGVRGLYLRKASAGKGYCFLRYMLNGRRREYGLGSYPDVSLDSVREKARKARELFVWGIDPIEDRARQREEARRREEGLAASVAVSRADGAKRIDADGNRSAAEGLPLQELAFRLPGACGTCAALDLPRVMQAVHSYGSMPSRALEFAILTASSPRAVLLAQWEEFDLERGVWTVPAEHDPERAARGDLVVYLSRRARTVLDTLPDFGREEKKGLVFSDVRGGPLPQDAMERRLSEIPLKWFLQHDFRGDGDGAGVELERRLAMEAWGEFASSLIPAWHPKEPED